MRQGFTIIELVLTLSMMIILSAIFLPSLRNSRSGSELRMATESVAALLREAQGRALRQSSSTDWGVRLMNSSSSPSYVLFGGSSYATSGISNYATLPQRVRFSTSSIPFDGWVDIIFGEGTGRPFATSSVILELTLGNLSGQAVSSSAININKYGAVSY